MLAKYIIPFDIVPAQTDHSLSQIHDPDRFPHIQHEDVATRTECACL